MIKSTGRLTQLGNSVAMTVSKDVLKASELRRSDDLGVTVWDDDVIEISHGSPEEILLADAFEWSLRRYGGTYTDLAR